MTNSWQFWALLSAGFAALTAIFAKIGIEGVNSNYATFLRTIVVVLALGALVWATGQVQPLGMLSGRTIAILVLSGLMTGASWLCYFRALQIGKPAQVAPVDKLSVVFRRHPRGALPWRATVALWLARCRPDFSRRPSSRPFVTRSPPE